MQDRDIAVLAGVLVSFALTVHAVEPNAAVAESPEANVPMEILGPVVQDTDAIDRMESAEGTAPLAQLPYPLYDDEGYLMPLLDPRTIANN